MNYDAILDEVARHVRELFRDTELAELPYHNLAHTEGVVARVEEIGRHYQVSARDRFVLHVAAWFHDMGYASGGAEGHEARGVEAASRFLQERKVEKSVVDAVRDGIMATVLPQDPHDLLQEILADADLYHFGTTEFRTLNKLMRRETEARTHRPIDKSEWRKDTIALLEAHTFQTKYCRDQLGEQKTANLEKLKEKGQEANLLRKKVFENSHLIEQMVEDARRKKEKKRRKKKKKGKKNARPDKGIETIFRVSSSNHQRLSDMADNKANIMITTTSIIISVLLSVVVARFDEVDLLSIPTVTLLTVCVVTMVFSILATRPTIPDGLFTQEDVDTKQVNLLFFGNFYRMSYEDYYNSMKKVMADREFLYGSLTRDVYSQGVVLGRKYRLLRIAYSVFMFGIIASVVAFIGSAFLGHQAL